MKKFNKIFIALALVMVMCLPVLAGGCFFNNQPTTTYSIVVSNNSISSYGTVYGTGTYTKDEQITIAAVANEGYVFNSWNDGNTNPVRKVTVTNDKHYKATFVPKTKSYMLNSISLYVTNYNGQTLKMVELYYAEIYMGKNNKSPQIGGFNENIQTIGQYRGVPLLLDNTVITTNSKPFVIYTDKNQNNIFTENSSTNIYISASMTIFTDNNILNARNYGANKTLMVNPSSSSTYTLWEDVVDNYFKIMVKLDFVEI